MHARAERREDANAPVADLVAEALDDDGAIRRDDAGNAQLILQEREQVARGGRVEPDVVDEPLRRLVLRDGDELARELADRSAQLVRPADALALPELNRTGNTSYGRHEHG